VEQAFLNSRYNDLSGKCFIVTGATGFLGYQVCSELLYRGGSVIAIDNMLTGRQDNIIDHPNYEFYPRDIREVKWVPWGKIIGNKIAAVIHLAAIARSAWPDRDEIVDTNVGGTEAAKQVAEGYNTRFVYASSCCSAMPTINEYSFSKRVGENIALRHPLGGVALRFSNIYGAGQSQEGAEPNVLASWVKQANDLGEIRLDAPGNQERDFLHVTDAANAVIMAATNPAGDGNWIDICTGVQTSLGDVAEMFENRGYRIVDGPARPNDPFRYPQCEGKANTLYGFVAKKRFMETDFSLIKIPRHEGLGEILELLG
jgi:UDP-glucose 4-epimerase